MRRHKGTVKVAATVRLDAYSVIRNAVWDGVAHGWQRAHKHTDSPSQEAIVEAVMDAVMLELEGVLKFDTD